eukprot:25068-Pleurochrysis_carterae.AAC.1
MACAHAGCSVVRAPCALSACLLTSWPLRGLSAASDASASSLACFGVGPASGLLVMRSGSLWRGEAYVGRLMGRVAEIAEQGIGCDGTLACGLQQKRCE